MEEKTNQNIIQNAGFLNPNILQFRLDTAELISNLQRFLSGEVLQTQTMSDGSNQLVTIKIGEAIANKKGIQHIINHVSGLVNPSVVQGNYTFEQFENHIKREHDELAVQICCNYHDWGIDYNDTTMVATYVMNLLEPFLSRLIDNLERESYAQTLKSVESSRLQEGGSKLKSLFGGLGQ